MLFRSVVNDFCGYYLWLINRHLFYTQRLATPAHGAHVSIVTIKIHKEKFTNNVSLLKEYHNTKVLLPYDNNIHIGGKGDFLHFSVWVHFPLGDMIKKECGIVENNFLGFHITIASNKSELKQKPIDNNYN